MIRSRCSVPECENLIQENVILHTFPRNKQLRMKWLENIGSAELMNKSDSAIRAYKICNNHFEDIHFQTVEKIKLNRGAVPTLRLPLNREERIEARELHTVSLESQEFAQTPVTSAHFLGSRFVTENIQKESSLPGTSESSRTVCVTPPPSASRLHVISAKAYCKIILHAVKYPHCAVNGVLLAKSTKSKEIEFVDAVPLFHIALNLTPMAEIALTQIDQVASQSGLVIAGYYMAHENLRDNSLEKANHRIADKIADNFASACLVVVDNRKLSMHLDNIAINVAQHTDGKYRSVDVQRVCLKPSNTLNVCSSLLGKRAYKRLVDFDNHLDDITLDWKNEDLNQEIQSIL